MLYTASMNSLESPSEARIGQKPLDLALYNRCQMMLAMSKFGGEFDRNEIMDHWANSNYSSAFDGIVRHPDFETHPRFRGDYAKITIEDLDEFKMTGNLPED